MRIGWLPLFLCAAAAPAATLYDGSLGTNPGSQGWIPGGLGPYTESVEGGGVLLTTSNFTSAGYTPLAALTLDRDTGYRFSFDVSLDSESHGSPHRAGLSLVLIGDDLLGLEIAFWTGEVWVQNADFTHGEGAALDATERRRYDLTVLGSAYALRANGAPLLAGSLRDYSARGLVYEVPNFLFVGDDTTSAGAAMRFYQASLTELPEPGTWAWAGAGLLAMGWRWRGRPRARTRRA